MTDNFDELTQALALYVNAYPPDIAPKLRVRIISNDNKDAKCSLTHSFLI